jgi:hypothetical protein
VEATKNLEKLNQDILSTCPNDLYPAERAVGWETILDYTLALSGLTGAIDCYEIKGNGDEAAKRSAITGVATPRTSGATVAPPAARALPRGGQIAAMELATFRCIYTEFPSFLERFNCMIHNNHDLT